MFEGRQSGADGCHLSRMQTVIYVIRHRTCIPKTVSASAPKKSRLTVASLHVILNQALRCRYSVHPRGILMNKDQVKGQVKTIAGKVQQAKGKLVDSKS